jgi:hypothetical protein
VNEKPCDNCGTPTPVKDLIDEGYRVKGEEITLWVCRECFDRFYEEAMYYMPDY